MKVCLPSIKLPCGNHLMDASDWSSLLSAPALPNRQRSPKKLQNLPFYRFPFRLALPCSCLHLRPDASIHEARSSTHHSFIRATQSSSPILPFFPNRQWMARPWVVEAGSQASRHSHSSSLIDSIQPVGWLSHGWWKLVAKLQDTQI
jgi:hypothetical protein